MALAAAMVPLLALRLRAPRNPVEAIAGLTVMLLTAVAGYWLARRWHHLFLLEHVHMIYLLIVVTIPAVLLGWLALAKVRGGVSRQVLAGGVVGLLLALGGIWGTHIAPNRLSVDRETIASVHVSGPIRIGVLADLQTPEVGALERKAIAELLAGDPDLVVVPGDLFQGNRVDIDSKRAGFVALLAELVAEVEIVAVVSGDHDKGPLLPSIVAEAGAVFLDNQIMDIVVADQEIRLSGVSVEPAQRRETIAALGTETDLLSVLISHRPGVTYDLPVNTDVDLIIAGHTHGGQVQLPFLADLVDYSDVPAPISNGGLHEFNGFSLYVSTGVGMERGGAPQLRFGVPPEVVFIDIVPEG